MDPGRFHASSPIEVLRRTLRHTLEEGRYDYILIDCPPSLGLVTLNGLRISDYYLVPTIPDFLSTYGIPQIIKRIGEFSEAAGHTIELLGILATKYRAQSPVHNQQLKVLQQGKDAPDHPGELRDRGCGRVQASQHTPPEVGLSRPVRHLPRASEGTS